MVEKPKAGAGQRDPVLAARVLDLCRAAQRSARLRDGAHAVGARLLHVVAERKQPIGDERHTSEQIELLRPIPIGELRDRVHERVVQPEPVSGRQAGVEEPELPVDPILPAYVAEELQAGDNGMAT